jgi:hypothetical protein
MTSDLEVVPEERRAGVLNDGHDAGASFRVWLAMNSSMSASVNILCGRLMPWPVTT